MLMTIGYTRVSTDEQPNSMEVQGRKIESYCIVKDWTLDKIIRDDGQSARNMKRLGMQEMISLVKNNEVSVVIVSNLDRLTRSVSDLWELVRLFETYHVSLVSLGESIDATTATGRLMMSLLASVSQWERERIGERTKEALKHLKLQGKTYCAPVITDKNTIHCIHMMRKDGISFDRIAKTLNSESVPTARGGKWHARTVQLLTQKEAV